MEKSDIRGKGYGSCHTWKRTYTAQVGYREPRYTIYLCSKCSVHFCHFYERVPDIFDAMKSSNIPKECKEPE